MTYRLGKNPPRHDARTLLFEDYRGKLPGTPAACDFMSKVPSYPMFGNDTCGDCAEAAMRHLEMGQTWYSGRGVVPTLRQTIADYSAIGGYVPGDQSTDNGSDLLTALNYYRKQGVITAFAQLANRQLGAAARSGGAVRWCVYRRSTPGRRSAAGRRRLDAHFVALESEHVAGPG